jgi:hypothetical protein
LTVLGRWRGDLTLLGLLMLLLGLLLLLLVLLLMTVGLKRAQHEYERRTSKDLDTFPDLLLRLHKHKQIQLLPVLLLAGPVEIIKRNIHWPVSLYLLLDTTTNQGATCAVYINYRDFTFKITYPYLTLACFSVSCNFVLIK